MFWRSQHFSSAWTAAAVALLSVLVFLPQGLHYFFQNDDWVLLGYYGQWPAHNLWRVLLPWESVWMYRPLQSLQYALLYKAVGLAPLAFNVSMLLMHTVFAVLLFVLVRMLGGGGLAMLSMLIFCLTWVHSEALLWKGNINTLQHACLAVAACICFVRASRGGGWPWASAATAFVLLDLLAKESAVFTPALMLLCAWGADRFTRASVLRWAKLIAPSAVLCVMYAFTRLLYFKNVLPEEPSTYRFVDARRGLFQFLYVYKFALLSFYEDPLLLPRIPAARAVLQQLWGPLLVLPLVLLLIAWRTKDRVLLFALMWMPIAFGPALLLERFNVGRYYYLADAGASVVWAQGILALSGGISRLQRRWVRAVAAAVGGVVLAYCAVANVATIRKLVNEQQADSERTLALFQFIQAHRNELPARSVLWIRPPSDALTGVEWGAREMTQFATGDRSLEGQVEGEPLGMARRARLDGYRPVYLDMSQTPWRLAASK